MENDSYTNKDLAEDYFDVAAQYVDDSRAYEIQRKLISELGLDLPKFFLENGKSLDKLAVKGIGKKTKEILELILDQGADRARSFMAESKIQGFRSSAIKGTRKGTGKMEPPPSWDNAVKIQEKD